MSLKSKVFAAAATLTLIGTASAAGALSAGTATAATPSCGSTCISLFPREYSGTTLGAPQFVLDVLRKLGLPLEELSVAQGISVLETLALTEGLVGVAARFAKVHLHMRAPKA